MTDSKIGVKGMTIDRLGPGDVSAVDTSRLIVTEQPFDEVDLTFVVAYKPSFIPHRISQSFRFVAIRKSNGSLHFYPKSKK